jgi:TonB family protein
MTFRSVYRPAVLMTSAVLIALSLNSAYGFQKPGARDPGKSAPTPAPSPASAKPKGSTSQPIRKSGSGKTVSAATPVAQMTIIIPVGCRIWINDAPVETSLIREVVLLIDGQKVRVSEQSAGVITFKGIRPGTYRLVARKPDFREYANPVTVTPNAENVFTVTLTPTPGKLTVSPSLGGAEVEIVNLETNTSFGRYFERLDRMELTPGSYRVTTSKTGYKVAVREIRVNPGETVYLEPLLELLPRPTPTPKPPAVVAPMNFTVQRDGKYHIFYLQGASGDSGKIVGSVTVSLDGPARNTVTGNLNGLPCEVELMKLENIAEASIVEAPGPGNNWASMVVRIRPKDEKRRPISFAIDWRSLPNPPAVKLRAGAPEFVPAQVVRRVQPEFPLAARGSKVSGTVLVQVTIDTGGTVTSAKAIEGPLMFRRASEDAARKWKFRPATRDGQVTESDQILQFRFEP